MRQVYTQHDPATIREQGYAAIVVATQLNSTTKFAGHLLQWFNKPKLFLWLYFPSQGCKPAAEPGA